MTRVFSFALPAGMADFTVAGAAKAVQTKKWIKTHKPRLGRFMESLFTANSDKNDIVFRMLLSAYGDNIGRQVFLRLSNEQVDKVVGNMKAEYLKQI